MRQALYLPNIGYYADPGRLVRLAEAAEAGGWDGVFVWDHIAPPPPLALDVVDAWTVVTAILARTRRVLCGPLVTPLARRRPGKVAREAVTLDRLSGGRVILGVGLGADSQAEFASYGEDPDARVRAARLDEALDVIDRIWTGTEQSHEGVHYRLRSVTQRPTPLRPTGVPVWVAATWPHRRPLRRAAARDGVLPMVAGTDGSLSAPDPEQLRGMLAAMGPVRSDFAVAVAGRLDPRDRPAARRRLDQYAEAGATWWLESFDPWRRDPRELTAWLEQGPLELTTGPDRPAGGRPSALKPTCCGRRCPRPTAPAARNDGLEYGFCSAR